MVLVQKWPFFQLFFFGNIGQENVFYDILEYRKTHFPGVYCIKEKVGKITSFAPKPWVNPFGKMSIFRLFELLVVIA